MPNPRFQVAVGAVDGVNRTYETSVDYTADTLVVFRNGAMTERSADNGWVELGGSQFEMKAAPLTRDVIHVFFMDTLPSEGIAIEVEVEKIIGVIEPIGEVVGFMNPVESIDVVVQDVSPMIGVVLDDGEVLGIIEEEQAILGYVRECG